jgi:hypothetical protein
MSMKVEEHVTPLENFEERDRTSNPDGALHFVAQMQAVL